MARPVPATEAHTIRSMAQKTGIFWRRVVEEAPTVGTTPIVIIPMPDLGKKYSSHATDA